MRDQKLSFNILFNSLWGTIPPQLELLHHPISRVIIDSREATPDSLFVALQGETQDGHDFIANALSGGSLAVIAEPRIKEMDLPDMTYIIPGQPLPEKLDPPYAFVVEDALAGLQQLAATWRREFPALRVVAVTGSVGKTSVKELTASVLGQRYATIRSRGNYNNEIGLPLTMLRFTSKHQRAVLEMGMYALGEIRQLAQQALPSIGIVTNVGPTHLERLGTLEAITDAKAELVEALPAEGTAILNGDDPRVLAMAGRTKANVFTYGLSPTCDLWANNIESRGTQGVHFQLHTNDEHLFAAIPLLGRHSVHNALAAASVGLIEGEGWDEIIGGMKDISAQLRLLTVSGIHDSMILDDTYNASPDSTMAALNLLAELPGRKIAVLGDMLELGSFELSGHQLVGRRAADIVSMLIVIGSRGQLIGEAALQAGMETDRVAMVRKNQEAIDILRKALQPEDAVLVKGSRGMRMEEIVAALSTTKSTTNATAM